MSNHIENLKEKADKEAFQHTVFRAIADLYNQLNPEMDIGDYLLQLQEQKEIEKNRIINDFLKNIN